MIKKLAKNSVWNASGLVIIMVTGFVVTPFLVHRLGETGYGLWVLIASFTSYFGQLDLGVRGSVGRQVALRTALEDRDGVNAVLSLALGYLSLAGLIAMLGTFGVSLIFTRMFEVPVTQVWAARTALLLVGLNLALWLPLNIFDATLWAYQRFDAINAVDIASALVRTILTFVLIGAGGGLVTVAGINLLCMAGGQAAKAVVVFSIDPALRVGIGRMRRGAARDLFGTSLWYSVLGVARTANRQLGSLMVGLCVAVQLVTPFNIAMRLITYGTELIVACTGVLTPLATALHARDSHDHQRELFTEAGKFCLAMALFFASVFLFLGRPLIELWVGPSLAWSSRLLAVLAVGEFLPMSQIVTNFVLIAMGRHRWVACVNLLEVVGGAILAYSLLGPYGLPGICVGFAVMATLCRGVAPLLYGCKQLELSVRGYLQVIVLPCLMAATPATLALALAVAWAPPRSSVQFLCYAAVYSLAYFGTAAVVLIGPQRLGQLHIALRRRFMGLSVAEK